MYTRKRIAGSNPALSAIISQEVKLNSRRSRQLEKNKNPWGKPTGYLEVAQLRASYIRKPKVFKLSS